MSEISLKEARSRLSHLVDLAEQGETTTITRRGRKVARVAPLEERRKGRLPRLAEFRASLAVTGAHLSRQVVDGRQEERF